MALMCALTMLQVTDVSAAEIAKGDVITIESIKTSTDEVASNYSTNSDMLLSRIVQEGMVPTSKRSNVIHEDDLVITETEITYRHSCYGTAVFDRGYFAHSFMGANNDDANISKASAKTDAIKETDASEQKKAQKDKKYVLEDDDSLKVTVTDVDVSGKTFKQVKKEMQEEAKKMAE